VFTIDRAARAPRWRVKMRTEGEPEINRDEIIELGAASEPTQAVGDHSLEPNMEPRVWM